MTKFVDQDCCKPECCSKECRLIFGARFPWFDAICNICCFRISLHEIQEHRLDCCMSSTSAKEEIVSREQSCDIGSHELFVKTAFLLVSSGYTGSFGCISK